MNNGLLSIIVPVYNVEKYLDRCMESLLNQTYQNKEIILIDDGSTDDSGLICDRYNSKYPFVYVIHKKNGWQGEARNFGLDISKGEYVAFVDPDDWIEPDGCQKLIQELDRTESDFVIGEFIIEYDDRTVMPSDYSKLEMNGYEAAFYNLNRKYLCTNSSCNKIFRRDFIGEQRFPLKKKFEDTYFVQNAVLKAEKVYKTGIPYYHHYQRKGSTTHHSFTQWHFHLVEAYELFDKKIGNTYPKLQPFSRARLAQNAIDYINAALSDGSSNYSTEIMHCFEIIKSIRIYDYIFCKEASWTWRYVLQHLIGRTSVSGYRNLHRLKKMMIS